MLRKLLSSFDPRGRVAVSIGLAALAGALGYHGLLILMSGPWYAILFSAAVAAVCVSGAAAAWPENTSQLPGGLETIIDRFQKQKGKATKTAAGRVFWLSGRAVVVGMLASYAIRLAGPMPDLVAKLLVCGFGLAVGFFGLRAGLVAGALMFLVAHRLTLAGLNVDIADPVSRAGFLGAWGQGWAISWWWPLGVLALVPAWVGVAAAANICGVKASEAWAEHRALVETRRKIEKRRKRLQIAKEHGKLDPVAVAGKEREAAAQRVAAIARGADGRASPEESQRQAKTTGEFVAKASEELKGVDKLTDANVRETLRRYIAHVREINEQEAQGIDLDTVTRRGFDRLVQAMTDAQIRYLREGKVEGAEILLAYYNRLCGLEAAVAAVGDGEIVAAELPQIAGASPDPDPTHDVLDGSSGDMGSSVAPCSTPENPVVGPVKVKRNGHLKRIFDEVESGEPMLASSTKTALRLNPDGSPEAVSPLPMASSEAGTALNEAAGALPGASDEPAIDEPEQTSIEPGASDGEEIGDVIDNNAVFPAVPGTSGALENEPLKASQGRGDTKGEPSEGNREVDESQSSESEAAASSGDNSSSSPDPKEETEGQEEAGSVDEGAPGEEDDRAPSEKPAAGRSDSLSPPDDDDVPVSSGAETTDTKEQETGEGNDVKDPVRHHAAGVIVTRKFDREFVLQTRHLFSCASEVAAVLSFAEDLVEDSFEEYATLCDGAALECALADHLAAQSEGDIRASLQALEGSPWEPDPDLIKRATEWLGENSDPSKQQLDADAQGEEQRAAAAAEVPTERSGQERLVRDEPETAERLKELETRAKRVASHILLGALNDDILDGADDLFPDAKSLAEATGMDLDQVEGRFLDFDARRRAKRKLGELLKALEGKDLLAVKVLLKDVDSFREHPDAAGAIQNAEAWVKEEDEKQKLVGLNDTVYEPSGTADEELGRRFLKRRLKVTEEQVKLIETELPRYLTAAANLRKVLDMMGEDASEAMRLEYDKVMARAAAVAAKIVAQEKPCREYANAYFPLEHCKSDGDVWNTLVELANSCSHEIDGGSPQAAEQSSVEEQESEQNVAGQTPLESSKLLQVSVPVEVASREIDYEETQKIDVKEYFETIEKGELESWDHVSRRYKRLCYTILPNGTGDDFINNDVESRAFYLRLPDMEGRIRIHTEYSKIPFLYKEAEERVYVVDANQGNIGLKLYAGAWMDRVRGMFVNGEERKDRIRGIIYVSPYIKEDGIISFERLLGKVPEGPVMICNNDLSSDQISAFVERIKGARG